MEATQDECHQLHTVRASDVKEVLVGSKASFKSELRSLEASHSNTIIDLERAASMREAALISQINALQVG